MLQEHRGSEQTVVSCAFGEALKRSSESERRPPCPQQHPCAWDKASASERPVPVPVVCCERSEMFFPPKGLAFQVDFALVIFTRYTPEGECSVTVQLNV